MILSQRLREAIRANGHNVVANFSYDICAYLLTRRKNIRGLRTVVGNF